MSAAISELEPSQISRLLTEVVERNYPISVELKDGSAWLRYKSRFLGLEEGNSPRLWIEAPEHIHDATEIDLLPSQRFIGGFTHRTDRFRFASAVVRAGEFQLAGGSTKGVMVTWPARLQRVQRRRHFRYEVPPNRPVTVRLWDGGLAWAEKALEEQVRPVYRGRLVDVSVGGSAVRLLPRQQPRWQSGDLVGMEFTLQPGDPPTRLEAIIRRISTPEGQPPEFGVQFFKLEESAEGRRTLDYLSHTLAEFERRTIRRQRVGLE